MQSNQISAWLFYNTFEHIWNMMQPKQIIESLFSTVMNMLKIWCNQNRLLHHLYQGFQNKFFPFKRWWCNQNKSLHHYFKRFWTHFKCDGVGAGLGWPGLVKQNFIFFSKSFSRDKGLLRTAILEVKNLNKNTWKWITKHSQVTSLRTLLMMHFEIF